ncbi:MAG: hypothetical protein Q7S89_03040 [bacterium]|nr:hypothetical protein [bacterium]
MGSSPASPTKIMGMNRNEAQKFVDELKNNKEFVTRFHDDEWGLKYIGVDRFKKWSNRLEREGYQEILSEDQVISLMMEYYSYEIMKGGLRPEDRPYATQ